MQKIKLRFNQSHIDAFNTRGVLNLMFLDFTNQCNLRCLYCFNGHKLNGPPSQIGLELLEKILKSQVTRNVKNWFISGGEPLCYPGLDDALEMFRAHGHRPKIATNGVLLNPAAVDKWVALGVQSVQFSLDTLRPSVFREVNGGREKDHQAIIDNLRYAVRSPLRVVASSVLTERNKDEISDVMRFCYELGLDSYTLYPLVPPDKNLEGMAVPLPDQLKLFDDLLGDYHRLNSAGLIDLTIPCFQFTDVYSHWKDKLTIRLHSCGAGEFNLKITSEGKVSTCICQDAAEFIVGDLLRSDIDEIWDSREIRDFRSLHQNIPDCRDCAQQAACRGGCRNEAYVLGNRGMLSPDPHCVYIRQRGMMSDTGKGHLS